MDLAWEKQRSTWRSLVFMRVEPPAQFTNDDDPADDVCPTLLYLTTLMLSLMGAGAASHGIEGAFARDREQQVVQQDLCK